MLILIFIDKLLTNDNDFKNDKASPAPASPTAASSPPSTPTTPEAGVFAFNAAATPKLELSNTPPQFGGSSSKKK
jgi:hypothetical protein